MSINSTLINSSVLLYCPIFTAGTVSNNAYNITRICLLLPLSILILYLGHRRWRQQRSFKTMSHSDMFTYHNAALEIFCNLGSIIYLCGFYFDLLYMKYVGFWFLHLTFSGEAFFHLLTCIERYLAVVHPIMYMGLRNSRGVMIRNISIGCTWLLSFAWGTITSLSNFQSFPIVQVLCLLLLSVVVVSFSSLSVLWVLIHPGPGDGGRTRERVNPSKQRAFFSIMAITAVLYFWFVGLLVCFAVGLSPLFCETAIRLRASGFWFSLPSSLVLPLLYLHRTGKLSYRQNSRQRK